MLKRLWSSEFSLVFLIVIGVACGGDQAFAQTDDGSNHVEREPAGIASGRPSGNQSHRAQYRLYAGGMDEEDLQVQDALPTPTRYPDGTNLMPESLLSQPQED